MFYKFCLVYLLIRLFYLTYNKIVRFRILVDLILIYLRVKFSSLTSPQVIRYNDCLIIPFWYNNQHYKTVLAFSTENRRKYCQTKIKLVFDRDEIEISQPLGTGYGFSAESIGADRIEVIERQVSKILGRKEAV